MPLGATFVEWLSAVATTAAVVVALGVAFLPIWHDKRQRPRIHLKVDPKGSRAPVNWWTAGGMRLRVHNAPGKRTAEQVEVFASLATRSTGDDSFWFPIGRRVEVTLVITGANFDAVTFRGEFTMSDEAGENGGRAVVYEWTKPPTELREVAAFESGPFR